MRKCLFFILFCSVFLSAQTNLINSFRGLNSQQNPILLSPSEASITQNCQTEEDGTLQKCIGFSSITAIPSTYCSGAILGGTRFRRSSGEDWIIIQVSSTVFKTNADGTYTMIATSFSYTQPLTYAILKDNLFMANGTDDLRYSDGYTDGVVKGISGKYITAHNNTLVIANTPANPSEVRACDLNDNGAIDPTNPDNWKDDYSFYINPADGSQITGIVSFQGKLLCFKRTNIWGILDFPNTDVEGIQKIQYSSEYGCVDNGTIQTKDNEIIFLSEKGLIKFNGSKPDIISNPIRTELHDIDNIQGQEYRWLQNTNKHFSVNTSSYGITDGFDGIQMRDISYTWNSFIATGSYNVNIDTTSGIALSTTSMGTNTLITMTGKESNTKLGGGATIGFKSDSFTDIYEHVKTDYLTRAGNLFADALADGTSGTNRYGDGQHNLIFDFTEIVIKKIVIRTQPMKYGDYWTNSVLDPNSPKYFIDSPINTSLDAFRQSFYPSGSIYCEYTENNERKQKHFGLSASESNTVFTADNINQKSDKIYFNIDANVFVNSPQVIYFSLPFFIYDISAFTVGNSQIYQTTGTYTSATYDTGISSPAYGRFIVSMTTNTYSAVTFYAQSSANGSTWNSQVLVNSTNAVSGVDLSATALLRQRYVRWMTTLETSSNTYTPSVNSVTWEMTYSTGQFISQKFNAGTNIFQWNRFITSQELTPNTTIDYYIRFATGTAELDTAATITPWITATSNLDISAYGTTGYWLQYRADLFSERGASQPVVNSFLFTWFEGAITKPMYSFVDDNGKYYLSVNNNSSSNNKIYVLDKNMNYQTIIASASFFTKYKNSDYFGSSIDRTLYKFDDTLYTFAGQNSNSIWKTGDMTFGTLDSDKKNITLYVSGQQHANSNIYLDWFTDNTLQTSWHIDLSTPTGTVREQIQVPLEYSSNFKSCSLQIRSTNYFQIINISAENSLHEKR